MLAGYDADKAVDALPKVLDLAAAGGLDLAYASDLVTKIIGRLDRNILQKRLTKIGGGYVCAYAQIC